MGFLYAKIGFNFGAEGPNDRIFFVKNGYFWPKWSFFGLRFAQKLAKLEFQVCIIFFLKFDKFLGTTFSENSSLGEALI